MRTIAHISDLHFGREQPEVVEGLVADLLELKPTVLVASGDFTQRARRRQYAKAAAFLRRLPFPQIRVPGNHDIPLFDVARRFFAPLTRYRQYITDELRPFYQDDELAVLGINTARSWSWTWNGFWKDGRISDQQLDDVRRIMCSLPPHVFRVLVTHHPFIPPPRRRLHGIVGRAQLALKTLHECGVDMVLAGHLHMGYSGDVRSHFEAIDYSILSVQAGTGVSDRRRREPNAYNVICVEARGAVSIAVRAWNGTRFDDAQTSRFQRVQGIWTAA